METISSLSQKLNPRNTVLFLGAGASVTSGAPTAAELARRLSEKLANGEVVSDDFTEACSILEDRYGRNALINELRTNLRDIEPTGGMLVLPEFPWKLVFSTNFDRVVEKAYKKAGLALEVIRSNFDFDRISRADGSLLYKIHGCISQDVVDDRKTGMTLTESDYERYGKYRQILFSRLHQELITSDVLFIGYSLQDRHLKEMVLDAARANAESGGKGRVFLLSYERNEDRARLLERRGISVIFGSCDELFDALSGVAQNSISISTAEESSLSLPIRIRSSTIDVSHARHLKSKSVNLFNGYPATYADISAEITFQRSIERRLVEKIIRDDCKFAIITGSAGVGKTTVARRLTAQLLENGFEAWEHNSDFTLRSDDWIVLDEQLRSLGKRGVLLIDDCPHFLRQAGIIAESIASRGNGGLSLILTSSSAAWNNRVKSPAFYSHGTVEKLSILDDVEIQLLVNIAEKPEVSKLADAQFSRLSRQDKLLHLQNRCSADMFVCLKNIFAFDSLDNILLREYASLSEDLQEVYRHVSALEASGAKVHRQLLVRVLGINANNISTILGGLDGIVREYDVSPEAGIYGWQTRHAIIARTIAQYKFFEQNELYLLINKLISALNPTYYIELRNISDLCNSEFGIGLLENVERQIELYNKLIQIAPGERVPRHRLISCYLKLNQLELADIAIGDAQRSAGWDAVLSRARVRLLLKRAEMTEGLLQSDRVALIHAAISAAKHGIESFPANKTAYRAYCDVGVSLFKLNGDVSALDDAISLSQEAAERILDPEMFSQLRHYEGIRRENNRYSERISEGNAKQVIE